MRLCYRIGLGVLLLVLGPAVPGAPAAKEVLVVDLPGQPATLDPHVQWDTDSYTVYRNIFDNLVARDSKGTIVPQVATSWKYVGSTTLDLELRHDIRFHDGSPLTVEDVVFSVKRIINPAFKSPQLSQFNSIVEVRAVGPHTVRLTTAQPYPALLAQLVKLSIVPKAYVEKVGDETFNLEPMGSGPYKFVSWKTGVKVELAANRSYWRGAPPFPRVEFHAVPEAATRVANLRTGKSDIIRNLNPDDVVSLKGDSRVQVLSVPTERVAYVFINAQHGPTRDVRVRQAIGHAIDRQMIIDALQGGFARRVDLVLTPASFGYVEGIPAPEFSPARARALLAEAGAQKAELSFITSPVYDQRVVQAIQQMLGEVGLKVTISTTDQRTFLKRRQGTPEEAGSLSMGRWSCACQDVDGVIFPLFHSKSIWAKYANAEFDAVVEKARTTLDGSERLALYRRAFEILRADLPGLGLYQDVAIYAARRELNWEPTPNEAFFVFDMKWGG